MDPESMRQLACAAMRDLLTLSTSFAVARGSEKATWALDEYKIPVPAQGSFDWVSEKVSKIPVVGKASAAKIESISQSIAASCSDAATAVCCDAATAQTYCEVIAAIDDAQAVALCERGGDALSAFLIASSLPRLTQQLRVVVDKILKTHAITSTWKSATDAYNAAAKTVGAQPLDFDISDYVLQQTLGTLNQLIRAKEAATRLSPGADASEAIVQVFGAGQTQPSDLIMHLVLVKKGDPRQFVLDARGVAALADETAAPAPLKTDKGLHLVATLAAPLVSNPWSFVEMGIGQPATHEWLGTAPAFSRKTGGFIAAEVFGAQNCLDVANGRLVVGSRLILIHNTQNEQHTWRARSTKQWLVNDDGTISPARAKSLVLGVRVPQPAIPLAAAVATTAP